MDPIRTSTAPLALTQSFAPQGAPQSRPSTICRPGHEDAVSLSSEAQEEMSPSAATTAPPSTSGDYRDGIQQVANGTSQAAGLAIPVRNLARVAGPVAAGASVVSAGVDVHRAVTDRTLTSRQRSGAIGGAIGGLVGGAAGGFAGGQGGALAGAAIGTAIAPGVGTVVGGFIGSVAGGTGGALLGGRLGRRAGQEVGTRVGG